MGWGTVFMLDSPAFAILMGVVLGYLAGIGVGGGSLLILWLTLVLNMDAGTARAINLMFFITAAGSVSIIRWRQGTLNLKKILPAILAGCCAAGLFSFFSYHIDQEIARKLFGILLLVTGVRELCYRPRNAK